MPNAVFASLPTTIFEVMSSLARELGAVNLGQGFPDTPGPLAIREAAARACVDGPNQYPSMRGLAELRAAVAAHYRARQGLDLDFESEVTITSGATEALAASLIGLIEPGDEVIVIQPMYDAYAPLIRAAGGTPRFVSLQPPDWRLSRDLLEAAVTPRTRMVVFNNPLNPAGVVFPDADLRALSEVCVAHDLIAVCDEVWEEVVFAPYRHRSLITEPGMRERTVKIGSAGKMFALTGWKIGFVCAAPALTAPIAKTHQFLTFTTPPNLQAAIAFGLTEPGDWFEAMPRDLARSRARLAGALEAEGYVVLPGGGTYFLCVDLPASGIALDDADFCMRALRNHGVAAIPVSAFYETGAVTTIARLCFAKLDATLDAGALRLGEARRAVRAGR